MRSLTVIITVFAYLCLLFLGISTNTTSGTINTVTSAEAVLSAFINNGLECKDIKKEKSPIPEITKAIKTNKFIIYEYKDIESANKYLPKQGHENDFNFRSYGNIHVYVWDDKDIDSYFNCFKNFMN